MPTPVIVDFNALPIETNPALTDYTANDSASIQLRRSTWQKIYDLFFSTFNSVTSGISAAGTNQATATILTKTFNRIDTVGSGTGVKEDATNPVTRTVQNNGANDLKWYPYSTDQFYLTDGSGLQGAGIPITIASGNSAKYIRYTNGQLTIQG